MFGGCFLGHVGAFEKNGGDLGVLSGIRPAPAGWV